MSEHVHSFGQTLKESFLILVFEALGTCFLASLFQSFASSGDSVGMFCGFFVLLIFCARISGSHFNPAVTIAFMFRRDTGRFSRVLGFAYILAQFIGAMAGSFLAYTFFDAKAHFMTVYENERGHYMWSQVMVSETIGTSLLVFLYLSQTEEKTKLSDDPAITTLIISASYYAAMFLGYNTGVAALSPLNPAIATGLITFQVFEGDFSSMHFTWIYCIFGFLGSLLAVVLFEYVYKRSQEIVNEEAGDDNAEEHMTSLIDA